jgi:hypothetical protein
VPVVVIGPLLDASVPPPVDWQAVTRKEQHAIASNKRRVLGEWFMGIPEGTIRIDAEDGRGVLEAAI